MSGLSRNVAAATRERERRKLRALDDPFYSSVSASPEWDAFFGSLHDQEEAAQAAGMRFGVDWGAFGRPGYDGMDPAAAPSGRNLAITLASEDISRRLQAQNAERDAFNNARQRQILGELGQGYDRQVAMSQLAPPIQPHTITKDTTGPVDRYAVREAAMDPTSRAIGRLPMDQQAAYAFQFRKDAREDAKLAEEVRSNKANEALLGGQTLSDAAIEENARLYLQTGQMPTLGQRDPGNRQRILNKAAEFAAGGGGNIAANKADYKADSGSLVALQKQRDAVGAFEDTALKNLQVFLDLAAKVPDSGSPAMNVPLRAASEKMFGNEGLAAYNAARRTVVPEFAKILSNPALSGQLTDSARHEVEEVLSGNATLKQVRAVAELLKTDAANRRQSYDDQLKVVRGRIAGSSAGGGLVKLSSPDGTETMEVPADQVEHYLRMGAKKVGG